MGKGFGGMGGMLRDAQKQAEGMQRRLAELQRELKERVYEGTAGGGTVAVHVNGQREILAVKIAPEAVDRDEVEMLEDLVKVAVSQALKKAADAHAEAMGKIAGGLGIPGMF